MKISKFKLAKVALLALFMILTVLQLFSFPGQFANMREVDGIEIAIAAALTTFIFGLILCAQITIFCAWRITNYMENDLFFTQESLTWVSRLVKSLKGALVFPIALILVIAPLADDPGVMVMLSTIALFVFSIFMIASLLRDQIRTKIAD